MPGEGISSIVELELERLSEWKKYYEKPVLYAKKIKEVARKRDSNARVILFGSIVKGEARPNSDIDVLVITCLAGNLSSRLNLRIEIANEIGEFTPFEIHIITPEEYENWYRKFIDEYIEI